MKSHINKISVIAVLLILFISVLWDMWGILNHANLKKQIGNYIEFEGPVLDAQRAQLIQQIQTSLAFKSEEDRMRFKAFDDLENQNAIGLEKNILSVSYFQDISSIPSSTGSFEYGQECFNLKSPQINKFCNKLNMNGLLEALNHEVFDDSYCGFSKSKMGRPVYEDSVYIGSIPVRDGRSKYAFRINGQLFSDEYFGEYTIPKADTLRIETIVMRNKWLQIDTAIHTQTIASFNNKWRKISGD